MVLKLPRGDQLVVLDVKLGGRIREFQKKTYATESRIQSTGWDAKGLQESAMVVKRLSAGTLSRLRGVACH